MPEALSAPRRSLPGVQDLANGYREIEQYAPTRYVYFEQLVFQRYLNEQRWQREYPDGPDWPGLCRTSDDSSVVNVLEYLLKKSSAPVYKSLDPPVIGCASPASH